MSKNKSERVEVELVGEEDMDQIQTGLVPTSDGVLTEFSPDAFIAAGFSEERTLKICAPEKGGVPAYVGQLIGPGPDITLNELLTAAQAAPGAAKVVKTMPTWQFHPVDGKTFKAITTITDTIICPNQLDQICKRVASLAQSTGKEIQVAIKWDGMGTNRVGQPLNKYRAFPRVVEPSEKTTVTVG